MNRTYLRFHTTPSLLIALGCWCSCVIGCSEQDAPVPRTRDADNASAAGQLEDGDRDYDLRWIGNSWGGADVGLQSMGIKHQHMQMSTHDLVVAETCIGMPSGQMQLALFSNSPYDEGGNPSLIYDMQGQLLGDLDLHPDKTLKGGFAVASDPGRGHMYYLASNHDEALGVNVHTLARYPVTWSSSANCSFRNDVPFGNGANRVALGTSPVPPMKQFREKVAEGLAVLPRAAGALVYVSNPWQAGPEGLGSLGTIQVFDVDSATPEAPVATYSLADPRDMAFNADHTKLWVLAGGWDVPNHSVIRYDVNPSTGALTNKLVFALPGLDPIVPEDIAVAGEGGDRIYVADGGPSEQVIAYASSSGAKQEPVLSEVARYGNAGGYFGLSHPGKIEDSSFWGLEALAVHDAHLFVAHNRDNAHLKQISLETGNVAWVRYAELMIDTMVPTFGGAEGLADAGWVYSRDTLYRVDFSRPQSSQVLGKYLLQSPEYTEYPSGKWLPRSVVAHGGDRYMFRISDGAAGFHVTQFAGLDPASGATIGLPYFWFNNTGEKYGIERAAGQDCSAFAMTDYIKLDPSFPEGTRPAPWALPHPDTVKSWTDHCTAATPPFLWWDRDLDGVAEASSSDPGGAEFHDFCPHDGSGLCSSEIAGASTPAWSVDASLDVWRAWVSPETSHRLIYRYDLQELAGRPYWSIDFVTRFDPEGSPDVWNNTWGYDDFAAITRVEHDRHDGQDYVYLSGYLETDPETHLPSAPGSHEAKLRNLVEKCEGAGTIVRRFTVEGGALVRDRSFELTLPFWTATKLAGGGDDDWVVGENMKCDVSGPQQRGRQHMIMSFVVEGDYIFAVEKGSQTNNGGGHLYVFRKDTGAFVTFMGPRKSITGTAFGFIDVPHGVNAARGPSGKYYVGIEEDHFMKGVLYVFDPTDPPLAPHGFNGARPATEGTDYNHDNWPKLRDGNGHYTWPWD